MLLTALPLSLSIDIDLCSSRFTWDFPSHLAVNTTETDFRVLCTHLSMVQKKAEMILIQGGLKMALPAATQHKYFVLLVSMHAMMQEEKT